MRVLVLGGTTEASELARLLAGDTRFDPVLSLAGRTAAPKLPSIPFRIGGFGGAVGLATWLGRECINAVVDATHPFAARMSANAVQASAAAGVPLVTVMRPAWVAREDDRWCDVGDMAAAAAALGSRPRRVWLTIGGNELSAFRVAPHHDYLVRAVDPPPAAALPPRATVLLARGPFDVEAERRLIAEHRIDVLVTKNSGGTATSAKLAAARQTRLAVVMVRRPEKPCGAAVETAEAAMRWLTAHLP